MKARALAWASALSLRRSWGGGAARGGYRRGKKSKWRKTPLEFLGTHDLLYFAGTVRRGGEGHVHDSFWRYAEATESTLLKQYNEDIALVKRVKADKC